MKIIKYSCLLTSLLAVITLTGCNKAENTATNNTNQATVTEPTSASAVALSATPQGEVLNVGVDGNYPPYDFRDDKGNATGFDVDIIKAIGEKQGFSVNVLPDTWENVQTNLDKGGYDLSISGYSITDERQQKYLVSKPYAFAQDIIAVKQGLMGVNGLKDLAKYSVSTQADTPYIDDLKEAGVQNIKAQASSFLAFKELATGKSDAMLADKGLMLHYAKSFPEFKFDMVGKGEYFEPYELVILAPKGKEALMEKVNAGIDQIIQDGTYAEIYKKWFGIAPIAIPMTTASATQ